MQMYNKSSASETSFSKQVNQQELLIKSLERQINELQAENNQYERFYVSLENRFEIDTKDASKLFSKAEKLCESISESVDQLHLLKLIRSSYLESCLPSDILEKIGLKNDNQATTAKQAIEMLWEMVSQERRRADHNEQLLLASNQPTSNLDGLRQSETNPQTKYQPSTSRKSRQSVLSFKSVSKKKFDIDTLNKQSPLLKPNMTNRKAEAADSHSNKGSRVKIMLPEDHASLIETSAGVDSYRRATTHGDGQSGSKTKSDPKQRRRLDKSISQGSILERLEDGFSLDDDEEQAGGELKQELQSVNQSISSVLKKAKTLADQIAAESKALETRLFENYTQYLNFNAFSDVL